MKKATKLKIGIIAVVLCVLSIGLHRFDVNITLGEKSYSNAMALSFNFHRLAKSIDKIEAAYRNSDNVNHSRLYVRGSYDRGIDDMLYAVTDCYPTYEKFTPLPLANDVISDVVARVDELKYKTAKDEDFEAFFSNEENWEEVDALRKDLQTLSDMLANFKTYYKELPMWKRYFISWSNVSNQLNEKIHAEIALAE